MRGYLGPGRQTKVTHRYVLELHQVSLFYSSFAILVCAQCHSTEMVSELEWCFVTSEMVP